MLIVLHSGFMLVLSFACGLAVTWAVFQLRAKRQAEAYGEIEGKAPSLSTSGLNGIESATQSLQLASRQLTESMGHTFWIADLQEKRLVYVSPSMRDAWLLEPRAISKDPSCWLDSVHPADRTRADEAHAAMFRGESAISEYRVVRPDGEIRWVRSRSCLLSGDYTPGRRAAQLLEDITSERAAHNALQASRDELVKHVNELKSENRERRLAEEQFRAAKELAEAGSRAKSQFLCNISHELRTPLNGIMGMVQLALESDLSNETREFLNSASESAAKLLAIVNDVLDFAETDAGRLQVFEAPFHLRDAVREVVIRVANEAAEKQLDFAWYCSSQVPNLVSGDKRRLVQVLTHLCANAVKFTAKGHITLEVSCDDGTEHRRIKFVVSDTGIGIPQENRSTIFEPFTQGDGSLTRSHGGTGIGLAICSRLVELMSGEISIDSKPGEGSRFTFSIPLGISRTNWQGQDHASEAARPVLVLDPDPVTRDLSSRMFAEEQFAVVYGSTEPDALEILQKDQERFAAVLVSAQFGDGEGIDLARRISDRFGLGDKLLVQLSQANQTAQIARCRELGISNTVGWPLDYDDVRQRLRWLLSGPSAPNVQGGGNASVSARKPVSQRSLRVLLVEDNPINQILLKRMLEKQGHSVVKADHGLEALARLEEIEWAVDVVLMDVQMPEMDGYQATAEIRARERVRGGHVPIIAATAHAMAGDAERCLSAGMDGYLSKPIHGEALSRTIAAVLDRRETEGGLKRKVS